MNNNNLDKIHVIEGSKLSGEFYFESLTEQAKAKGLLSNSDIERIQYECLSLLAYKTERYNSGDSSSIQIEKAQGIMTSILFTIGIALKTYSNPDDAVADLKKYPIIELYQKGRKRIDSMLMTTKAIHVKLIDKLIDTSNVFYPETLKDGISGFFKLYYPDYSAQEIHITADYPIFNPMPKLAGIEFIKAYVESAYYENQFCAYFSAADIHHLLCGYSEGYQELLINIYELVLTAALGCSVSGTDIRRLDVTEIGKTHLQDIFSQIQSDAEILMTLQRAADELNLLFEFSQKLMNYIQTSLPIIAVKIRIAARQQTLNRVFFTPAFPENRPKITFSYGDRMEDEQYRKIIDEIIQCRFSQDKIAIIKESVFSLSDLECVLLDAELSGKEMQEVLRGLTLTEVAALYKKYPPMSDVDIGELRKNEQILTGSLYDFVSALPQEQQKLIANAATIIEEE